MLILEIMRIVLGIGVLITGIFGVVMAFNTEKFGTKGIALLLLTIIILILFFHSRDLCGYFNLLYYQ